MTPPSLDLINVLEQLTELGETFYFLDDQFIIKRYNSGTARQKRRARYGEECRLSKPSLNLPIFPNRHMFTSPEALPTLSFWVFKEASFIGMID